MAFEKFRYLQENLSLLDSLKKTTLSFLPTTVLTGFTVKSDYKKGYICNIAIVELFNPLRQGYLNARKRLKNQIMNFLNDKELVLRESCMELKAIKYKSHLEKPCSCSQFQKIS